MSIVVSQFCIDAADPRRLATWWAEVLGWQIDDADPDEIEIAPADGSGTPWLFLPVPEQKTVKNRVHPDIRPPDGSSQAAELERLLGLGARPVDVGQGPDATWHVLADPEGNEFCLLRSTPSELAAAAEGEAAGSAS